MILRLLLLSLTLLVALPGPIPAAEKPAGVTCTELHARNGGRIWVYLPPHPAPGVKLPCVLVPPAGSRLFHGMTLTEGDRQEHVPYAAAGFMVVSCDLSGPWPEGEKAAAQRQAIDTFLKAKGGVTDVLEALQVAADAYPQMDPKRIYIAGHSSAGTLALQVAASSDRIKACVAYAPVIDVEKKLGEKVMGVLETMSPGISRALHEASPAQRAEAIHCPVLLFHALDDRATPPASIENFKNALTAHQTPAERISVETGGHFDSMIQQGIPKGIAWLKAIDEKQSK